MLRPILPSVTRIRRMFLRRIQVQEVHGCQSADYRDAQCGGFVNKMNTYSDAERQFWSGLRVPSRFKEGTDGSGTDGMDNSDFAMICSHGWTSTSPNRFTWAMYHVNSTVHSTEMRLGDDGLGLSILLNYTCDTMNVYNGHSSLWRSRWWQVFNGGLRTALGFWGLSYSNTSNSATAGTNFAECIHGSGAIFRNCWFSVMSAAHSGNTPIVMVAGSDMNNAFYRLQNMSMSNWYKMARLRDSCALYLTYSVLNSSVSVPDIYTANHEMESVFGHAVPLYAPVHVTDRKSSMRNIQNAFLDIDNVDPPIGRVKHDKHIDSYGNERWQLMSYDDGSHISYINREISDKYGYKDLERYFAVSSELEQTTKSFVESIARDFRDRNVVSLLNIHKNEKIVPLTVDLDIVGFADKKNQDILEYVNGYWVSYYRTLPELPVIGSGSKINVLMNSRKEVYGVNYDWVELKAVDKADVITKDEYLARKYSLIDINSGDWKEQFEYCGYYDPGSENRLDYNYEVFQPACYVGIKNEKTLETKLFLIPILESDQIILQNNWPESYHFAGLKWDKSLLGEDYYMNKED